MFYDELITFHAINSAILENVIKAIIKEKFVVVDLVIIEYQILHDVVEVVFKDHLPGAQTYFIRNEIIYSIMNGVARKNAEQPQPQIELNTSRKRNIKICKKKG